MPTLEEFFSGKKKEDETPLMMRGVFGEGTGEIKYNPEDYSKGIPVAGNLNKEGKVVTPTNSIKVDVPVKEVAKPMSDTTAAVAAEAPKMEQSRAEELKAMFSPQPVSDLIDVNKVQMQAEQMTPQASWSDVLMGLIPVVADAMAGGHGDALDVSAKYYGDKAANIEKRKQSLEDKLMELEKSRALASLKGSKSVKDGLVEVDVDGKPIFTRESKAEGLPAWKKPEVLSNEAGKQARFEQARKDRLKLSDRQFVAKQVGDLNKDLDFKTAKARYAATNDAINVLNQKNWAGDQGAGFLFAKGIFGEVGSLTNEERSAFIANPVLENKYNVLFQKYLKDGTFTDEDRSDLQELAVHMRKRAESDLSNISSNYIESSKAMGVDISSAVNPLLKRNSVQPLYIIQKSKENSDFGTFEEWKKRKGIK